MFNSEGALLHDVGTYSLMNTKGEFDESNYIQHGMEGYDLLKKEGFDEIICRFAERHTGVGISKGEIIKENINLPPNNYFAESMEEKLVMYADKFHSKDPQFNSFDTYREHIRRFGEEKVKKFESFRELFGIPDLEPLAEKYNHPIT